MAKPFFALLGDGGLVRTHDGFSSTQISKVATGPRRKRRLLLLRAGVPGPSLGSDLSTSTVMFVTPARGRRPPGLAPRKATVEDQI